MYIIKNAWTNIIRNYGRNILIGIIIIVITISSCVSLSINSSGNKLVESYINQNQLEVTLQLDMDSIRENRDEDETIDRLTVSDIETYGDSDYVSSYYYTLDTSVSSDDITAIDISEMFEAPEDEPDDNKFDDQPDDQPDDQERSGDQGDFKITAYSDVSYISDFVNGNSKITSGTMITNDNDNNEIIISEDLAEENDLEVGDTITFYLPSDSDTTYEFEIIGIFKTTTDTTDENFMNMTALNSQNQIYTTVAAMNNILEDADTSNSLNAKFYLTNSDDLETFTEEVREKGLSDYYTVTDNTDEITATLEPIENISNFSLTFLIIILIVGAIILTVINLLNIRDRKYEIGVLRAIGMSKGKLILELITELFIVAVVAFIIGTTIGKLISQPVTNKMLENEINSYQTEVQSREENFGGKGFENPQNRGASTTNYVDNLTVTLELSTLLELFGVSILLVIISGAVSVIFVTKYEPNKILQNRN